MGNELQVFDSRNYLPLALPADEFREALEDNLGDSGMNMADLMRIKVPAAGGRTWDVGEDSVKEIKGLIIYHTSPNAYWAEEFSGGNTPPDCASNDGHTGIGNPGGECARCAMNQFGSDGKRGKACKNSKRLYILMEGNMLPVVISLPPGSLKAYRQYTMGLTTRALAYWACETIMSLSKEKNPDGIEYSVVQFKLGEILKAEDKAGVKAFRAGIIPLLTAETEAAVRSGDTAD